MIKLFCFKVLKDICNFVLPIASIIGILLGIKHLLKMLPVDQHASIINVVLILFYLFIGFGLIFMVVNYFRGVYTEVTSTIRRRNNKNNSRLSLDESYWLDEKSDWIIGSDCIPPDDSVEPFEPK